MKTLNSEEVIILGTAIAFEISKSQTNKEIKNTCALLGQVLYTLSNLCKE